MPNIRSNNVSPAGASAGAAPSSSFVDDGDTQWAERDFQSVYETAHREEVGLPRNFLVLFPEMMVVHRESD